MPPDAQESVQALLLSTRNLVTKLKYLKLASKYNLLVINLNFTVQEFEAKKMYK